VLVLNLSVEKVKQSLKRTAYYTHSKTGNLYSHYGCAIPVEYPDTFTFDMSFIAHDSENKEVEVVVYKRGGTLFYIPSGSPDLSENTHVKVLYQRGDKFWLRSDYAWGELVTIGGREVPRFVIVKN
jgi:hypothetical protein